MWEDDETPTFHYGTLKVIISAIEIVPKSFPAFVVDQPNRITTSFISSNPQSTSTFSDNFFCEHLLSTFWIKLHHNLISHNQTLRGTMSFITICRNISEIFISLIFAVTETKDGNDTGSGDKKDPTGSATVLATTTATFAE